jgi:hypothetical protein
MWDDTFLVTGYDQHPLTYVGNNTSIIVPKDSLTVQDDLTQPRAVSASCWSLQIQVTLAGSQSDWSIALSRQIR